MDEKEQPQPQHQVFINFRGKNLYQSSHRYPGEDEGQGINNLFKRIEDSRIALVAFSSRYTKSRWCLDELAKIKERQDQGVLKSSFIWSIVSNVLKLLDKISSTEQTAKYQPNHLFEQGETSSALGYPKKSILTTPQENLKKTQPRKRIGFNVGGSSIANPANVSQIRSVPSEIYHGNPAWHGLSSGSSRGKSLALYDKVSGQSRLKWLAWFGLRSSLRAKTTH
ncbi:hypothetical protein ARALYDRAFT_917378 [Arabidopsis lyrata subsp. lyrata]|uniref:TIR domain-containing protein n=1 Tax=Arabidopsis lyrata subsp. lyrata TaxID=81972 RepID=D7MQ10_ARALL|nr:hypothetical protein ARALYDRAFT_917378 [Arabidopsis lyrata subsp. lyrata]